MRKLRFRVNIENNNFEHIYIYIYIYIYMDQAKTKHAREFKEAWHSVDKNTINRHIDIPPSKIPLI